MYLYSTCTVPGTVPVQTDPMILSDAICHKRVLRLRIKLCLFTGCSSTGSPIDRRSTNGYSRCLICHRRRSTNGYGYSRCLICHHHRFRRLLHQQQLLDCHSSSIGLLLLHLYSTHSILFLLDPSLCQHFSFLAHSVYSLIQSTHFIAQRRVLEDECLDCPLEKVHFLAVQLILMTLFQHGR